MKVPVLKQKLLREMKTFFPARWKVADMHTKTEGRNAWGTMRIHCTADDKNFMSDFEAKLDAKGNVSEFALDGVVVKQKLGCPDPEA